MKEPPINRDLDDLDPIFRHKLELVLAAMSALGFPMKFHEGFRTVERQQWSYGQGRTGVPYARRGPIVTRKNGTSDLSNHQGTGQAGTGKAADCYPLGRDGKIIWPPPANEHPVWNLYATMAEAVGLTAGYRWKMADSPHVELA